MACFGPAAKVTALALAAAGLVGCPALDEALGRMGAGPSADFSADPRRGEPPLAVQFSDESEAGDAPIGFWLWTFGDGTFSTAPNPRRVYASEGRYSVSLWVTTAHGSDRLVRREFVEVAMGIEGEGEEEGEGNPALGVSADAHDFGEEETEWSFEVWNSGDPGSVLEWSAVPDQGWISVSPASGTSTGEDDRSIVSVAVDRDNLGKANFSGQIVVSATGTSSVAIALSVLEPEPVEEWNSEEVEWRIEMAELTSSINPTVVTGSVVKSGASKLRLHFGEMKLSAREGLESPDTGESWSNGHFFEVTTQAVEGGLFPLSAVPLGSRMDEGFFVISRVDYVGATMNLARRSGDLFFATQLPDSPTGLWTRVGFNVIDVFWDFVVDANQYEVWRGTEADAGTAELLVTTANTSYSDTDAWPGTTFYYWVRAVTEEGTSDFSTAVTGRIEGGSPPTAGFSASRTSGDAPLSVRFQDQSDSGSGTITSWAWDFGDGATSTRQNPEHIYTEPGTYSVSLTVEATTGRGTQTRPSYITVFDSSRGQEG